jgi:mannose-6-phosphate isomerase-like protein (cupin superfamily)
LLDQGRSGILRAAFSTTKKDNTMNRDEILALGLAALLSVTASSAMAQDAPPTFQADPEVYKVIFEDQNFRVISATWKKGVHDKAHSHPVPSVIYAVTDCSLRVHAADGKTRDIAPKAGTSMAVPLTTSHNAENIGNADCQAILVERK